MKKILSKVLAFSLTFCMLISLLAGATSVVSVAGASRNYNTTDLTNDSELRKVMVTDDFLTSASVHQFEGVSADEFWQIIDDGGQIYQNIRVQYDDRGTQTYRVPVQDSEIEYLLALQAGVQPFSDNPFGYTRIRYSGLPRANSIVVVLLGDGFTSCQDCSKCLEYPTCSEAIECIECIEHPECQVFLNHANEQL